MDYQGFMNVLKNVQVELSDGADEVPGLVMVTRPIQERVKKLRKAIKATNGDEKLIKDALHVYRDSGRATAALLAMLPIKELRTVLQHVQTEVNDGVNNLDAAGASLYPTIDSTLNKIKLHLKKYHNSNATEENFVHKIGDLLSPGYSETSRQKVSMVLQRVSMQLKTDPPALYEPIITTIHSGLSVFIQAINDGKTPLDAMKEYEAKNRYSGKDIDDFFENVSLRQTLKSVNHIAKISVNYPNPGDHFQFMLMSMHMMGAVIMQYEGEHQIYFRGIGSAMIADGSAGVYSAIMGQPMHFGGLHADTALQWQAIHRIEAILQKLQMR
jgi:hypothetical protein